MAKKNSTPFGILAEAVGLYFSNFNKFVKYMTFPVLGQVLGLVIVFATVNVYTKNLPILLQKYESLNNFNTLIFLSILITLPGLVILTKAIWEYLVAYGAVNSMLDNMMKSGKVYDFDAHTELIKRRTPSFIGLWLIIGLFSLIAVIPIFWIICGILAVYFILVFQVFTYEPEKSPFGCIKRSLNLVKGHFGTTFLLVVFAGGLTYFIIPQIVIKVFDLIHFNAFMSSNIMPLMSSFGQIDLTAYGLKPITEYDISLIVVQSVIAQILIQYTLPLRTIIWALWYNKLSGTSSSSRNLGIKSKTVKRKSSKKRPSEKLMEESHKKFTKTKIDRNILRRAMEKDDEE